jgi:hypothetical protein
MADMLQNISDDSYEDPQSNKKAIHSKNSKLISKKNLERIIRVHEIVKNKIDKRNDFLGVQNMKKFREARMEMDENLVMVLKKLGTPSFLKTGFREKTMEKYKTVNGKYFGCKV